MKHKRIMIVVGARPNFMKAAPLLEAIRAHGGIAARLVHTGQHFDENMSKVFFDDLGMPKPDAYLGIHQKSHTEQVARVMVAVAGEIKAWRPDLVTVVGDVNSTLAGGLAANHLGVRLAHVEAGLRSFDRTMPEEINRLLVDQLADYLFTPSPDADLNLKREGVGPEKIFRVGNIMVDTLLRFRPKAEAMHACRRFNLKPGAYGIVTIHRPSNVDEPESLASVFSALASIQRELALVFPVHPRTKSKLGALGLNGQLARAKNLILTEPLGYLELLSLMMESRLAITDSGGIQEETTVLGIPCLTVRANTERPITIHEGTNQLVGQSREGILKGFEAAIKRNGLKARKIDLWDGRTAGRIMKVLAGKTQRLSRPRT